MSTKIRIELQFDRDDITKNDIIEYLQELIEDDSLDYYSVSEHKKYEKEDDWSRRVYFGE